MAASWEIPMGSSRRALTTSPWGVFLNYAISNLVGGPQASGQAHQAPKALATVADSWISGGRWGVWCWREVLCRGSPGAGGGASSAGGRSCVPWSPTSQEMDGKGYNLNPGALFPALVKKEMKGRQMVPDWGEQRGPFTHLCPTPTAGCWELMNTWCSLVTFTAHLRQRGQVPPDATIALLAEDGHLVSLDERLEGASQAPSMGSPRLQERGTYVLVKIIKGEGGAPTRYESLLENLDDQYPELAEELHCLSGLHPTSDGRRRRTSTRRGHQEQGPLSRSRRMGSLPSRTR
ncbi:uncharacterized protein C22orf15 homolog isoform X2 [Vulpes lagopus]|uniref:uncharacterized protein C22orf15 homolog isoform X2 n=1 Tax=Vulpes lagopus TaxID=494514 RepID=UPI001BCA50A8|nr:uncharacterized protein C22orf15 homolog isoform X2 [Vulpes lagopus]